MVKVVKQPLKKTVGRTNLNFDELQTTVVEIEAIVNARPITYVYDDDESVSTPLTPSHLIHGRRITNAPSNQHFEIVSVIKSDLDKESEASSTIATAVHKAMAARVSSESPRTSQQEMQETKQGESNLSR